MGENGESFVMSYFWVAAAVLGEEEFASAEEAASVEVEATTVDELLLEVSPVDDCDGWLASAAIPNDGHRKRVRLKASSMDVALLIRDWRIITTP